MCLEVQEEPLQDRSVTTSCDLHPSVAASLDHLQLFVTFFLQPAGRERASSFKIWTVRTKRIPSLMSGAYLTCSSPPDRAAVLRACDGVRGATAAPLPASGARPTGRAWPAAGGLLTWEVEDLLVGPGDMENLGKA